jgi:hypothetical protein
MMMYYVLVTVILLKHAIQHGILRVSRRELIATRHLHYLQVSYQIMHEPLLAHLT